MLKKSDSAIIEALKKAETPSFLYRDLPKDPAVVYRPLIRSGAASSYLSGHAKGAFWLTKGGVKKDFPGATIVAYDKKKLADYCRRNKLTKETLEIYR